MTVKAKFWGKRESKSIGNMNLKAQGFGAILTEKKRTHSVVLMSLACGICESESHLVVSDSSRPHTLYSPWNSLGQNTGVVSLSLLQGIFPTQVSCIAGGCFTSWTIRETQEDWSGVAYPFSSGSSRASNRSGLSCIAGGFFTSWAIREALLSDSSV